MMRLQDLFRAGFVDRDFSEWKGAFEGLLERAACVIRPHAMEYDASANGYEGPTFDPYCVRCGYDYAAVYRRRSPWDFAPFSDATILRWYDVRLMVCCWTLDRLSDFWCWLYPPADELEEPPA
jgi:hypothetical protein